MSCCCLHGRRVISNPVTYTSIRYRFNATSCSQVVHTHVQGEHSRVRGEVLVCARGSTRVCKGEHSRVQGEVVVFARGSTRVCKGNHTIV